MDSTLITRVDIEKFKKEIIDKIKTKKENISFIGIKNEKEMLFFYNKLKNKKIIKSEKDKKELIDYYNRLLGGDSKLITEDLININKCGFITKEYKPFLSKIFFEKYNNDEFGIWTFYQQKQHISGFIKNEDIKKIINNIDIKIVNYVIFNKENIETSSSKPISYIRCRKSFFKNKNHQKKWVCLKSSSDINGRKYEDFIKEKLKVNSSLINIIHNNYSFISFSCKKYNSKIKLEKYILSLL